MSTTSKLPVQEVRFADCSEGRIDGHELETMIVGYSSAPFFSKSNKRARFGTDFLRAILWAIKEGKDDVGLARYAIFANSLLQEIRNKHPNLAEVEMYSTVGTRLDFDHGVDIIFLFGSSYVTIDFTIVPFLQVETPYSNHLIFSPDQMRKPVLDWFTRRVADELLLGVHTIPPEIRRAITRCRMKDT